MHAKPSFILVVLLGLAAACPGGELDYYRDVYPFLKANCISCHNKTTTKADLNMETPELMRKGGETGPGLVPGKGVESLVVQASLHKSDLEMPPKNNKSGAVDLTPTEVEILRSWIDQGAKTSVQEERQVAWQPLAPGVHPIYAVAMTRDGRYAACGRSNQIFVYDLATRQFVTQVVDSKQKAGTAHRALVQSLAFSPDGTRMASGSFREVKIWRLVTAAATTGKTKSPPVVTPAAPIGDKLLASMSGIAKTPVVKYSWSADAKQIVTSGADGRVRVWNVESGTLVTELTGSLAAARHMAALDWTLARQGLEVAFQKTELARIDAQNKSLDELLKKASEAIVTMKKVLPDKQKALVPASQARSAAQAVVDGLVAQSANEPAGTRAEASKQQLKDAQEKLLSTTMAETSAQAAVSATENNIKDAGADVTRITAAKAKNARDLAATNGLIASATKLQDKAAADLAAAKAAQAKSTAQPLAMAFSSDAQRVAAILNDGTLQVWAVASGMPVEQMTGPAMTAATLAYDANGTFTATANDGTALTTSAAPHWELERVLGGDKGHSVFADRVNAVCFSPDSKTLATGGGEPSRSGDIVLWDVTSGKVIKNWKGCHEDAVLSLDFSPDGRLLASGAADKMARVTAVATGKPVNVFEGHTHHVTGVAFRSDGRVLATSGADGVVLAWDMILGERKKKIEGWTKEVTSLQFIGATNQIVTSAGDNLIRIVNDEGAEVRALAKLPDFMQAVASTASGSIIIGGGEDSLLRVWDGTNGKEVAVFGIK